MQMQRQFAAKLLSRDAAILFLLAIMLSLNTVARAQLVVDGQTNVLSGFTTNLSGGLTVGTNGSFTLLVLINGTTVTNSGGNSEIGANNGAVSNTLIITGTGSIFQTSASILTGVSGAEAQLDVLNGGELFSAGGFIGDGYGSVGSNNLVLVSGAGSLWTNSSGLTLGYNNSGNSLVISNGGQVINGTTSISDSVSSTRNKAIVTGAGSSWTSSAMYIGNTAGGFNLLLVTNGGSVSISSGSLDIGSYTGSNTVFITDPSSSLTCPSYRIGYASTGNTCIISNGATLSVTLNSGGYTTVEGVNTTVIVTGTNSLWTNNCDFHLGQTSNYLYVLNGGTLGDINGEIIQGNIGVSNFAIVAGANSLWKNSANLTLDSPNTQLFITNGGTVSDNFGYVGDTTASTNCFVLISGAGSLWTNSQLDIGQNGPGNEVVVANSGSLVSPYIYEGVSANNNLLVVSNSGVVTAGTLSVGNTSIINTNRLVINGGIVNVTTGLTVYSYSTMTMNSGQVNAKAVTAYDSNDRITQSGGTMNVGTFSYAYLPYTVGDGTNVATLVLSNNTQSINNGIIVASNSTLTSLGGTINGNVTINSGGTFAPPYSNGTLLTVKSNLTLNNGSTTVMGLNPGLGSTPEIGGLSNVVYGGTLQITTNLGGSYYFGETFKLFGANSYSGMFTNIVPATPGLNQRWDLDELVVDGVLRVMPASRPRPRMAFNTTNSSFSVTASNGIPYDFVYLYTSTNLSAQSGGWTAVATNAYDINGKVSFTNLYQPGDAQRYFKLVVN